MLKQRVITALILIPITLLLLFYLPPPAFCVLVSLITLGAAWEWSNLMEVQRVRYRFAYLIIVTASLLIALFLPVALILIASFIWWLFAIFLILIYPRGADKWGNNSWLRGMMGLVVLVPCWAAMNYIRDQSDGIYSLLFLFALIWGADSAAYFAGKQLGKHKLAPMVSPGKSIEGLAGAMLFTVLISLLALWATHAPAVIWPWGLGLSLVTVLFSVAGDLFESMLKRKAGIKDSGRLLPGHGGLLDRIDSLTAAAPIFALGAILLGTYFS